MRTTLDVPDELYHSAKVTAAQRRTTLRELFLRGLEHALAEPCMQDVSFREKNQALLAALDAGNTTPMRPLSRETIYEDRTGEMRRK